MLMNSRGGPPFWGLYVDEFYRWTPFWGAVCWWFLEADPILGGYMLMNSRGRPAYRDNFYGSSGTSGQVISILGTNYFTILMCNPAPILPPYIGNPRIVSRINSLPLCWIRDQSQLRSKKIRENVCISACSIQWKLWVNPPIFTWAHFHVIFL